MRLKINVFSTYPLHKEARPNVHVSTNTGTDHPYHIYIRKGSDTTWTTVVPHTTRCNHRIKIRSCHVLDSLQNSWLLLGDSSFLRCPPQEGHLSNSESFQSEPLIQGFCETRGQRHWKEIMVLTKTNSGATVTDSTLKNIELNGPHLS